ncbi:hypothetical protein [Streptomonospora salina]|uniref:Uncharacterized protein n=1 Tax=Streptomonospora salina TaxID=104205 RepID=A0A841ED49_9ACTN|nr:hypothetical protein [Streptomonospora salina]MBB6000916.1 hypothetical protein [Streptomonospora salina]
MHESSGKVSGYARSGWDAHGLSVRTAPAFTALTRARSVDSYGRPAP